MLLVLFVACADEFPPGMFDPCDSGASCPDPLVCDDLTYGSTQTACMPTCSDDRDCRFKGPGRFRCQAGGTCVEWLGL